MQQFTLNNTADKFFQEAWNIYETSFPIEERRTLDGQMQIMQNSHYHFDILVNDEELIGILLWWEFDSLRFVDHFATSAKLRNRGFGQTILKNFIESNVKPVILEVEFPNNAINIRRIKFYQRIGLQLNEHDYLMPPMREDQPPTPLLLMSYPNLLTTDDVTYFTQKCHPIIFDK